MDCYYYFLVCFSILDHPTWTYPRSVGDGDILVRSKSGDRVKAGECWRKMQSEPDRYKVTAVRDVLFLNVD